MALNGLIIITGFAAFAVVKIMIDMCKNPSVTPDVDIEVLVPPKYEEIDTDEIIDYPPTYRI